MRHLVPAAHAASEPSNAALGVDTSTRSNCSARRNLYSCTTVRTSCQIVMARVKGNVRRRTPRARMAGSRSDDAQATVTSKPHEEKYSRRPAYRTWIEAPIVATMSSRILAGSPVTASRPLVSSTSATARHVQSSGLAPPSGIAEPLERRSLDRELAEQRSAVRSYNSDLDSAHASIQPLRDTCVLAEALVRLCPGNCGCARSCRRGSSTASESPITVVTGRTTKGTA